MANASARANERASVYERITADILAAIERGARQWRMPWHHDGSVTHRPVNALTAKGYRGLNIVALWAAAEGSGFASSGRSLKRYMADF